MDDDASAITRPGTARFLLGGVGLWIFPLNVYLYATADRRVYEALLATQGGVPDAQLQVLANLARVTALVGLAVGFGILVCAYRVATRPVEAGVMALVLYVGSHVFFAFVDPSAAGRGLLGKALIILILCAALYSARQEALSAERHGE